MAAIDHAQAIKNIITTKTTYTGGYFPNMKGINEVNATSKFHVDQGQAVSSDCYSYTEDFLITVQSTTAVALNAMVRTIFKCDTRHHNGFVPNGTHITANDYPYHLTFQSQTSEIEVLGPNEFRMKLIVAGAFVT